MKCANKECDNKINRGGKKGDLCEECQESIRDAGASTVTKSKLVDCPLLSYLSLIQHESSKDMMKTAILEFYSDAEISEAKEILWNTYDEELLGKKQKRNLGGDRSIREKETDDILEALSLVDRNQNEWDCVTFCCVNWRRLPRSSPEELNMISILDRLAVVEQKLKRVNEVSSSHTAQLVAVEWDMSEMKKTAPPPAMPPPSFSAIIAAQASEVASKSKPSASFATPSAGGGQRTHSQVTPMPPVIKHVDASKSAPNQAGHGGARRRTHKWYESEPLASKEEVKKMCDDLPAGFRYPPAFAKKIRIIGKKKIEDSKVSGAPNQRTIFVENVCRTTDDKDMEDYVNNIVTVFDFQRASVDAAARKSFKFRVLACDTSKVLDPDVWPEGIGCRLWQFRGKSQGSNIQQQQPT